MASKDSRCVLVTGGAGYIGSHCAVEILQAGHDVIIIDNCCNAVTGTGGIPESIHRVCQITGKQVKYHQVDIVDIEALRDVFSKYSIDVVIHLAALKAVGESVKRPLDYYKVNFIGTCNIVQVMKEHNMKNLIFSSSATVYGHSNAVPFVETLPTGIDITSPYGKSKYFTETMLKDVCSQDKSWNMILLRYFNPVGAHPSGLLGEYPSGTPKNLMANAVQAALGNIPHLKVFGNDYDTPDGTGVRDYPHVVDLAQGIAAALAKIEDNNNSCGLRIYNLGEGQGYSVLEMIAALEKASAKKVPYVIEKRRPGDIGTFYSDPTLAWKELGWKATRSLEERCKDLWHFHTMNPHGYLKN
ncbi:LOW QUALITY PROTEIN: UDP-glucose 4-epimerase-like [Amphiura filiformis]|uniref:LOW QUALITY PROTEIN: UDP-glucose 4-epimerase-like n=1 Tax=Amphiura filiformis TaxID=82378 RepID=UPI003B21F17A